MKRFLFLFLLVSVFLGQGCVTTTASDLNTGIVADEVEIVEEIQKNVVPVKAAPVPVQQVVPTPTFTPPSVQTYCCKTCRKGKACGDSCISRSYTCHKPPGCACDG